MDLNKVKEVIKAVHQHRIKTGFLLPLNLWGVTGIGKTQSVSQVARELGIGHRVIHLGQMSDVGDLLGIPEKTEDGRMCYLKDRRWPTSGQGIILLDEQNRAAQDINAATFELLREGRMADYELPPGWSVISACNPATDEYSVSEYTDRAFISRFVHVAVNLETETWLHYATSTDHHWSIRCLVKSDTKTLGNHLSTLPDGIAPSPHAWSMANEVLKLGLSDLVTAELLEGVVGSALATAWLGVYRDTEQPVRGYEVLNNYNQVRDRIKRYGSLEHQRQDLLSITLDDVAYLCEVNDPTEDTVVSVTTFINDLPKEVKAVALTQKFISGKAKVLPSWKNALYQDPDIEDLICDLNQGIIE